LMSTFRLCVLRLGVLTGAVTRRAFTADGSVAVTLVV
jgi:hypothetical protein